jgi:hypothetical protein
MSISVSNTDSFIWLYHHHRAFCLLLVLLNSFKPYIVSILSTSIPHCLITIITFKFRFRVCALILDNHKLLSVSRRLRRCLCTSTRNLRRTLILFGGAAGITHGILDRKNKDVDILVGVEVLAILYDMIDNRWGRGFYRDYDRVIKRGKCDPDNNFLSEMAVELD